MSRDDEVVRKIIVQRFETAYNDLMPYLKQLTLIEKSVIARIVDIIAAAKLKGEIK